MKIKVNDEVLVIAGKDKGKSGKVLKTFKKLIFIRNIKKQIKQMKMVVFLM